MNREPIAPIPTEQPEPTWVDPVEAQDTQRDLVALPEAEEPAKQRRTDMDPSSRFAASLANPIHAPRGFHVGLPMSERVAEFLSIIDNSSCGD